MRARIISLGHSPTGNTGSPTTTPTLYALSVMRKVEHVPYRRGHSGTAILG